MKQNLLSLTSRIYRATLRAYPPSYRDRFETEIGQVFDSLCEDTYTTSGAVVLLSVWLAAMLDSLAALIKQWWQYLVKTKANIMKIKIIDREDGILPLSATHAWLAALPFLVFGMSSMVSKFRLFPPSPGMSYEQILLINPFFWFYCLVLVGFGASLLAGFPRWGYAYLGWSVMLSWWWSDVYINRQTFGWRFWLPAIFILLIVLLLRRSWKPLQNLLMGIRRDLTLPSLALYIFYSHVFLIFDENHNPLLPVLIPAMAVVTALGAWGFFHSAAPLRRMLALIGGLSLAAVLSIIDVLTWTNPAFDHLPARSPVQDIWVLVIFVGALSLVMISNGVLASLREKGE